jgi:AraC family ethanolamine operon transcriptional activator
MNPLSPPLEIPSAAPAGTWRLDARTGDAHSQARVQPEWQQEYRQLSPGLFLGHVQHVQLPGMRLVREDSNQALHQRGDLGRGAYGFAIPLALSEPGIFNGQRFELDSVLMGRGDELDLRTPTQLSLMAVVVEADLLQPLWQRMYQKPLAAWLEHQLVVPARPAAAQALRRLHMELMSRLLDPDAVWQDETALRQVRDTLLIEWLEVIPERVDASSLPSVAARRQLVHRACELMLAQPDEPLSMLDLCGRVGASRRKLNYCFQDVLGTSPMQYLRAVRLNGVRRELRSGTARAVQDAAARWGFFHMGQFSTDYKKQFGELPSVTLRAAAAPALSPALSSGPSAAAQSPGTRSPASAPGAGTPGRRRAPR